MGSLFGLLLAGLIIGTVTSVGQTVASGVANKRNREAQATINQENIQAQKEVNQQNIDLQRSAIPDKFNQLTSLGMSRGAALQAVSGASYSPSSVATTQQAYQEQPLDFSGFGTLGNIMQLLQANSQFEFEKEGKLLDNEIKQEDLFEKKYNRETKAVLNEVVGYILSQDGIYMDNVSSLDGVRGLLKSNPKLLKSFDYNKEAQTGVLEYLRHNLATQQESANLKLTITREQAESIAKDIQALELQNKQDLAKYAPEINKIDFELMKKNYELVTSPDNISLQEARIKLGLAQVNVQKLLAELDAKTIQENPKAAEFANYIRNIIEPFAKIGLEAVKLF